MTIGPEDLLAPEKSPAITRPVVFVHGVRTSSAIWSAQFDAMTQRAHRSIAIDLPGHGARVRERFTITHTVRRIEKIYEYLLREPGPVRHGHRGL